MNMNVPHWWFWLNIVGAFISLYFGYGHLGLGALGGMLTGWLIRIAIEKFQNK